MTAYNKTDLNNKYVQQQVSEAFRGGCIEKESFKKILEMHPCKLYSPNYFIRIAIALLTIVCILFSTFLIWLVVGGGFTDNFSAMFILMSLICYGVLELMVRGKYLYNAGADNMLMIATVFFIIVALTIDSFPDEYLYTSFMVTIVCSWLWFRFTDAFMGMLAYTAKFCFLFLLYIKFGAIAKSTAPFVMMAISAVAYFSMRKFSIKKEFIFYRFSAEVMAALALITFYAAGNYYVIRELSNTMFELQLQPGDSIPFGWLFWVFTFATPVLYIFYGIKKKDIMFLRCGIILFVAPVFTVRYYYYILPSETVMIIAGVLVTAISYLLIQYLRKPRPGFTSEDTGYVNKELRQLESLVIAQVFDKNKTVNEVVQFGGGSSGGGGATGSY